MGEFQNNHVTELEFPDSVGKWIRDGVPYAVVHNGQEYLAISIPGGNTTNEKGHWRRAPTPVAVSSYPWPNCNKTLTTAPPDNSGPSHCPVCNRDFHDLSPEQKCEQLETR